MKTTKHDKTLMRQTIERVLDEVYLECGYRLVLERGRALNADKKKLRRVLLVVSEEMLNETFALQHGACPR